MKIGLYCVGELICQKNNLYLFVYYLSYTYRILQEMTREQLLLLKQQSFAYIYKSTQINLIQKILKKCTLIIKLIIDNQKYRYKRSSLMTAEKRQEAIEIVKEVFSKVENQTIQSFCLNLFPMNVSKQPHQNLYMAMMSLYQIKRKVNQPYNQIRDLVLKKGEQFNPVVRAALNQLYQKQAFNNILETQVNLITQSTNDDVIEIIDNGKDKEGSTQNTKKTISKKSNESHRQNLAKSQMKKQNVGSEVDIVSNISGGGICVCQKQVTNTNSTFVCTNCGFSYHIECMKRKQKIKHCTICHLKLLLPNKHTKKTFFVGYLRKGKKKHEFSIFLNEDDYAMKYRIQVRCFRIKETTQNFILFPDHAEIVVNGFAVKEFQPIHKQSSLKYRKDEPFFIDHKQLLPKQNKFVINQRLPSKQTKESRIQPQNHVIGLFVIEQKRIDALIKEISVSSLTTFEQSKKLLDSSYILSYGADSVSCQIVKIPLTCTLSTEKIKYPARGIFCNHYQCFDLQNFVIMISQSQFPRWVCPLCKLPCYQFKIDCILLAILEKYSQHPLTEVMLFKSGDFNVNAGQNKVINQKLMNIHDLPIQSLAKRAASQIPQPERKKKKLQQIIQPQNVISIDLD